MYTQLPNERLGLIIARQGNYRPTSDGEESIIRDNKDGEHTRNKTMTKPRIGLTALGKL